MRGLGNSEWLLIVLGCVHCPHLNVDPPLGGLVGVAESLGHPFLCDPVASEPVACGVGMAACPGAGRTCTVRA